MNKNRDVFIAPSFNYNKMLTDIFHTTMEMDYPYSLLVHSNQERINKIYKLLSKMGN